MEFTHVGAYLKVLEVGGKFKGANLEVFALILFDKDECWLFILYKLSINTYKQSLPTPTMQDHILNHTFRYL